MMATNGFCACGCGQPTKPADRTRNGIRKGEPLRYIVGHNARAPRVGQRYEVRDCGYKSPCWVWLVGILANGYGQEIVAGRRVLAHRAMYEQHYGPIPGGLQIDHLCRNPACVNPAHLEPVTNATNTRRGRATKLTAADVESIRRSPLSNRRLGMLYGVHRAHISKIRSGHVWTAA